MVIILRVYDLVYGLVGVGVSFLIHFQHVQLTLLFEALPDAESNRFILKHISEKNHEDRANHSWYSIDIPPIFIYTVCLVIERIREDRSQEIGDHYAYANADIQEHT